MGKRESDLDWFERQKVDSQSKAHDSSRSEREREIARDTAVQCQREIDRR